MSTTIKTPEELRMKMEHCASCLNKKFHCENGKRAIVVCGGTGCMSFDSQEIKERLSKIIKEKGLEEKISVNFVGCFGFCSQGPFVKIFPEDTLYRMVQVSDVDKIIEQDIIGGKVVDELLYIDPVTKEHVQKQDDINFYKKQMRIALHGCGVINPEDINEALGYQGLEALLKVLTIMKPQDVIDEILASGLRGRGGGGFPAGRKWQFAQDRKSVV